MLSGMHTEADKHYRHDEEDEPLPQSAGDDPVKHLLASLDRVLLTLIVQVKCAVRDNVLARVDTA
jgi:hypothetical protein